MTSLYWHTGDVIYAAGDICDSSHAIPQRNDLFQNHTVYSKYKSTCFFFFFLIHHHDDDEVDDTSCPHAVLCSWLRHLEILYSVVQNLPWCFPFIFCLSSLASFSSNMATVFLSISLLLLIQWHLFFLVLQCSVSCLFWWPRSFFWDNSSPNYEVFVHLTFYVSSIQCHTPEKAFISHALSKYQTSYIFSSLYSIYFSSVFHFALSCVFILLFSFCGYYWINICCCCCLPMLCIHAPLSLRRCLWTSRSYWVCLTLLRLDQYVF